MSTIRNTVILCIWIALVSSCTKTETVYVQSNADEILKTWRVEAVETYTSLVGEQLVRFDITFTLEFHQDGTVTRITSRGNERMALWIMGGDQSQLTYSEFVFSVIIDIYDVRQFEIISFDSDNRIELENIRKIKYRNEEATHYSNWVLTPIQ